jgi:hypothetical protein
MVSLRVARAMSDLWGSIARTSGARSAGLVIVGVGDVLQTVLRFSDAKPIDLENWGVVRLSAEPWLKIGAGTGLLARVATRKSSCHRLPALAKLSQFVFLSSRQGMR